MTSRPDAGSKSARLVLIGEAYGDNEERWNAPFVGPSGQLLERWWRDVGLERKDFYITNAWDQGKPPVHIDAIPRADMEMAFDRLHERLAALEGPDGSGPFVIVPTGGYALYALTGKGKVSWHQRDGRHERPGILKWRGSIMEYVDARGRRIKVIPTIHPAATFHTTAYERECHHDWARIASDSLFRELRLPARTHLVAPSLDDCWAYLRDAQAHARELSIDIETPRRVRTETTPTLLKKCECKHPRTRHRAVPPLDDTVGSCGVKKCECVGFNAARGKPKRTRIVEPAYLGCIGFGYETDRSLTIPTTRDYWRNEDDYRAAMDCVRALCALDVDKVLQNGLFDVYWLTDQGIDVSRYIWDTRAMHHVLDTTAPHDLAWLGVWYTRQPYWKCLHPETKILYSDLVWRSIKDAKVGDELIGFDETNITRKRRFRSSMITALGVREAPCFSIEFEDGSIIVASEEHPWLTQRYQTSHSLYWTETRALKPGMRVGRLSPPWKPDTSHEGGWLSGIFDGEGSFGHGTVFFCQNPGSVLERGKALLSAKGFQWKEYSKSEVGRVHRVGLTTVAETMRFLGMFQPVRLLERSRHVWEGRRTDSFRYKKLAITAVRPVGIQRVVGLTTTTKTFIAEGLYTHNSEAKDPDEIMRYASNKEALWNYNGIDVCVTLEVFYRLREALEARGRLSTYLRLYADKLPRLQRLSRHGVRVDGRARETKRDELAKERANLVERIEETAGMPLCAKAGGLSSLRLRYYLYGPAGVTTEQATRLASAYPRCAPLRLPKQFAASSKKDARKGERSVSTNEVIVRRLMQRFPGKLNVVGELILEHRRVSQLATFVQDTLTDADSRARCGYSPAVDTGRFSSMKNPKGTSRNLQNVDRSLREMYVPDE